jgi:hypothetical protein
MLFIRKNLQLTHGEISDFSMWFALWKCSHISSRAEMQRRLITFLPKNNSVRLYISFVSITIQETWSQLTLTVGLYQTMKAKRLVRSQTWGGGAMWRVRTSVRPGGPGTRSNATSIGRYFAVSGRYTKRRGLRWPQASREQLQATPDCGQLFCIVKWWSGVASRLSECNVAWRVNRSIQQGKALPCT